MSDVTSSSASFHSFLSLDDGHVQQESHCWRDELHSNVHCCHASQHDWVLDPQVFAKRSAKCRVHLSGLTFVKLMLDLSAY